MEMSGNDVPWLKDMKVSGNIRKLSDPENLWSYSEMSRTAVEGTVKSHDSGLFESNCLGMKDMGTYAKFLVY